MRRIGMTRDPADDFEDPSVPEGPLRQCVLYRIRSCPREVPWPAAPAGIYTAGPGLEPATLRH